MASGTVQLTDVQVPCCRIVPVWKACRPGAPFADSVISQFIQVAVDMTIDLVGTTATDRNLNPDDLWRNARTHTLHDPVLWKYLIVGNDYLNHAFPSLHAWNWKMTP